MALSQTVKDLSRWGWEVSQAHGGALRDHDVFKNPLTRMVSEGLPFGCSTVTDLGGDPLDMRELP